jgi:hypothetical protein
VALDVGAYCIRDGPSRGAPGRASSDIPMDVAEATTLEKYQGRIQRPAIEAATTDAITPVATAART